MGRKVVSDCTNARRIALDLGEMNNQPTQGAFLFTLITEGTQISLDTASVFQMTAVVKKKLISGALSDENLTPFCFIIDLYSVSLIDRVLDIF